MVLTVVLKSAGPADIGSADLRISVFGTIHPDIFRFRAPMWSWPKEASLPSDDGRTAIYDAIGSNNKPKPSALPSLGRVRPSRESLGEERATLSGNMGLTRAELSAKWLELQSRIAVEQETLAACRLEDDSCPAAARRFLSIVELGRQHQGRARLGEINRAINLSIKPVSDLAQYGVSDFWSAPLATLSIAAGDCEDYAILKYVALREIGIEPDDLQLVIVHDIKRDTAHAVVAVRLDEEWLILDNRTLVLVNTQESQYYPLFMLDHRGVRESSTAAFSR
jgi:predicted transglutaminase-like cysteine proteinase